MEHLKKNVENLNSGHAKHPVAPSLENFEGNVQRLNSGTTMHPAMHHINKAKKLP